MKTNLLKKALALVLSIMVVLTAFGGALSVFAEDASEPEVVVDPYGTEEDGIDTNGNDVFDAIDATNGVKNLDFAEGLKYWSSRENCNGTASRFFQKYVINGVTCYGITNDPEIYDKQYQGVATVRMQLNGVKKGETIRLVSEYAIDSRFTTAINKLEYPINGFDIALYTFEEGSLTSFGVKGWGNQWISKPELHGTWLTEGVAEVVAEYDNPVVAIRIQDHRLEEARNAHAALLDNGDGTYGSPVYFKKFQLMKANGDASYTDLQSGEPVTKYGTPLYGTEEDGIAGVWYKDQYKPYDTTGNQWYNTALYPVVDGFKNGDFSEGLKYWGFRYADSAKAYTKLSDAFEITAEGALRFKGAAKDNGSADPTYMGIVKNRFSLPGVTKGDTLKVFMDVRNTAEVNSAFGLTLQEVNGGEATGVDTSYTDAEGNTVNYDNAGFNLNLAANTPWTLKTSDTLVVTNENPVFRITSQANTVAGGFEIDNIRIMKLNADGVTYTDIVTGEECYADGKVIGGTYEDGWSYTNNGEAMAYVGPFSELMNGDFTNGLKYWGSRAVGAGSDYADVKLDGTNAYINLNNGGNADAQYAGVRSSLFAIPGVKKGDKLALMYNYRNGDPSKYESLLSVRNNDTTDTTWVGMKSKLATVMVAATDTAWGTAVNKNYLTVGEKIGEWTDFSYAKLSPSINDGPAFFIEFANNTKGVTMDIDNVQVVKYINDYTYETFDGEIIRFDPAWAGTFADGVTTSTGEQSQMNSNLNIEYGVVNGDFEKGLMYWGCSGAIGSTAYGSTHVDLVTEDGNSYFKFDGTTQTYYRGMKSGAVFIPKAKLAVGDSVVIKFDAYDPNGDAKNVQLKFEPRWGNGSSSNSSVNQCTQIADKGNGWKTYITQVKSPITAASEVTTQAPAAGDWAFYVSIQVAGNAASTASFDNIELVKVIDKYSVQTLDDDTVITWEPDWIGTFEDGVTNINTNHYNHKYGVVNGDFEEGLKYWGGSGGTTTPLYGSTYTDVVTENGNTYIKFDGETRTFFNGIRSAKISIPADKLKIGDQPLVMFDVYDPNGDAKNIQVKFDNTNGNGSSSNTMVNYCTVIEDKGNGWKTVVTQPKTAITANTNATADNSAGNGAWAFYITIAVAGNSASTGGIDNVELVKYIDKYTVQTLDDDAVITWDPIWAGTFEDGASVSTGEQSQMTHYINKDYYVVNGDFSKGLKFWGATGTLGSTCYGSTYVDLITEGDNHYVKFDGVTRTYFNGFKSGRISIPAADLAIGDQVALVFDVYDPDNTGNFQLRLDAADGNGSTVVTGIQYAIQIADKGNGWKTYVGKFGTILNASNSTDAYAVKAGDWTYTVAGEAIGNTASSAAIDNIKIVKKVTDYSVKDLATGETIAWTAAWIGTFDDGINAPVNTINGYYNTEYGVVNGDFSEGLKYWGVQGAGEFASSNADLKVDGDNYYIQLDGVARDGYAGFRSANLSIPAADLMVGDYVALKFDLYDPENTDANVQMVLSGLNMNEANETGYVPEIRLSVNTLNKCKVIEEKENGWKTVVTLFSKDIIKESVATKTVAEGDWQFVIAVEVIATSYEEARDEEGNILKDENGKPIYATDENGNKIVKKAPTSNAAFDNFEIVRADRGGFGKDALAVALDGSAIGKVNYGDANLDGKVDLVDLVRTKKYASSQASGGDKSPISFVSVDADASKTIDAADITVIINKLLGI